MEGDVFVYSLSIRGWCLGVAKVNVMRELPHQPVGEWHWNDRDAKYDIRDWSSDREKKRKCYTKPMSVLSSDTHPKIEQIQIELIQRMTTWKKFAIVDGLNETVKTLAVSGIKQRHPNATPQQVHRMLADLMLGADLARKVYDHAR